MIPGRSALLLPRALAAFDRLVAAPHGGQVLDPGVNQVALAEWLVRMILSLAMVAGPKRTRRELRTFIGTLLGTDPLFSAAPAAKQSVRQK